jgi:hypothetical protein
VSAPLLSIVKGEPSAEELAALTVVIAALSQARPARRRPVTVGGWASRTGVLRRPRASHRGRAAAAGGPA